MTADIANASEVPLRVLVIDDDDDVRTTLKMMLEDEGLRVTTACDGDEGVGLVDDHPFDLVITDLCMPAKSGEETIGELRIRRPDVRIIAISGRSQAGDAGFAEFAKAQRIDAVIHKPFDLDDLASVIFGNR